MQRTAMTIREASPQDQNIWDGLAGHPLQSWAWGEFRTSMGIDLVRMIEERNGTPVSCLEVTFHRIPHTPWTVGYGPKGPAVDQHMIAALMKLGRQKNSVFIQLEPNIQASSPLPICRSPNLVPSHHPLFTRYTFILDLTKSEDELLSAMHPKTRYNIRIAEKHGVRVVMDNSADGFAAYLRLTEETTKRQGFYAHTAEYHKKMWDTLSKAGIAKLFTASYKGTVLSAWIVFLWKDTLYYPYGSSSREHREVMAPNLLLREISTWAKQRGCKAFDLWGALGPDPNPHDPWYGFHRFKAGYRPALVEYAGSFDLVTRPMLYRVYSVADTVRWMYLKSKRAMAL
ncbi:peptidoglycan bridge formation glycyltransferase FemA/FemB family protein [Patescibacteria group bacterium]|nr:peptidoglycan bridge formation glycyltransferase FemA/FemB family protein [Patescibacteria group bacterium]